MSDVKLTDRIGLTDIFGIISPGIFVLLTGVLCIIGLVNVFNINMDNIDIDKINSILQVWIVLLGILAFFASYLFGSVVRLFANDLAERLSGYYLLKLRRKKSPIARERFPYPFAGKSFKNSNPKIYEWYRQEYEYFGEESKLESWNKKYFFNKCKADLYARSPMRAVFYERIESFVRFLSGALVSNLLLFGVTLPFAIFFFIHRLILLASIYITLAVFSFIVVIAILERFRNQHTREVMALWTSYYEACQEAKSQSTVVK